MGLWSPKSKMLSCTNNPFCAKCDDCLILVIFSGLGGSVVAICSGPKQELQTNACFLHVDVNLPKMLRYKKNCKQEQAHCAIPQAFQTFQTFSQLWSFDQTAFDSRKTRKVRLQSNNGAKHGLILTSTLTAYLTPNTYPSTPR